MTKLARILADEGLKVASRDDVSFGGTTARNFAYVLNDVAMLANSLTGPKETVQSVRLAEKSLQKAWAAWQEWAANQDPDFL